MDPGGIYAPPPVAAGTTGVWPLLAGAAARPENDLRRAPAGDRAGMLRRGGQCVVVARRLSPVGSAASPIAPRIGIEVDHLQPARGLRSARRVESGESDESG
jgi:hypothetical protein